MRKRVSNKITIIVFTAIILIFPIAFYVFSFNEPTALPPGDNTAEPLNIGTTPQAKNSSLGATDFYDRDDNQYKVDPAGSSFLNGPVGIGISPTLNAGDLQVARALNMVGGAGSYFKLPSLTKAQRDVLSGDKNGYIIYNSDNNSIQGYFGGWWRDFTACGQCMAVESGTCVGKTTNWGANEYGCIGANTRCFSGSCKTCANDDTSYFYDDGCSGCAGQGGKVCWHATWHTPLPATCDSTCNYLGKGNCVTNSSAWNDDSDCTVGKYLMPYNCGVHNIACDHGGTSNGIAPYVACNFTPGYDYAEPRIPNSVQICSAGGWTNTTIRLCVCDY